MSYLIKNISIFRLLAVSIGIVYFWFGALKFFPELSPADSLAKDTINSLTFGIIPIRVSIFLLAVWEVLVGLSLMFKIQIKKGIILGLIHMVLTFTPLVFFPELSFQDAPFTFTLVGQYIMKNIVFICAFLLLYQAEDRKLISDLSI